MRTFLLGVWIIALSFSVSGQPGHFKQIRKNASGTTRPDISFELTDGQKALKSTAPIHSQTIKTLSFQGSFKDERPIVVRKNNSPVYIERKVTPLKSAATATPEEQFYRFMEASKEITEISQPRELFKVTRVFTDDLGIIRIRSIQQYKGIEIYGSESTFHIDAERERFTGSCFSGKIDIPVDPAVDITESLETVRNDLRQLTIVRELNSEEKKFLHYDAPEYALVLYDQGGKDYLLAWAITIRPNFIEEWKYFIDAANGTIIRKFNNTNSDGPTTGSGSDLNNISRSIDVYLEAGVYYLVNFAEDMYNTETGEGIIMTLDANNTSSSDLNYSMVTSNDNAWTDLASAVSAHYNAWMAYGYFKSKFNRNSLNGLGGNIISFVNVADDDGSSMENAFWNGQAVFYGNGGDHFKSLAGGLDVAAHELGHGVVSNTANLEYIGQSGAMNESFADIFGSMVDREDWMIGEDVVRQAHYPSGALRNMQDPHNGGGETDKYWQPAHLSEMYLGDGDNGGVHINSGIGNHAFYRFATAVSKDKAELVYYKALTEYLTKTSQFIDLRIAVVESAKDLYGNSSPEAAEAVKAFDAVGIHQDVPPIDESDDYEPNPGQEHLLIYNTDPALTPTLWASPSSGNEYIPLSSVEMKGKVSVTDDGTAGVYVSTDSRIFLISLNPDEPYEQPLWDDSFFDNVAVSKDGNRLAAISTEIDTAIYVYDFGQDEWQKFRLYNPTTSDENINSGGVLFADAIEFDHTGEYLIYDAYNELNSDLAEDISYWDVGFIKVWDNQAQDFGDGTIMKLFTALPENVSVGNPVFSKNSPYIIAFDYYYSDGMNEEFAVYGANLETGDLVQIAQNTTLGYPSYSGNDDEIAITKAIDEERDDVYIVELAADKISPSGSPAPWIEYAKWPVFYATGLRELGLAPVANFTADYKTGSAPLQVKFVDLSTNGPIAWEWTFQGGTPSTSTLQNPEVTYNTNGTYRVTLKATNSTGENILNRDGYIVVGDATGIEDPEHLTIGYYPNPVNEQLHISGGSDFTIRIFSQAGQLLLTGTNQRHMDVSRLNPGLYILEIHTDSGISQHKMIKQ